MFTGEIAEAVFWAGFFSLCIVVVLRMTRRRD